VRGFGSIEKRRGVNEPGYEPPEPEVIEPDAKPSKPRYSITPVSFVLVCIGAAGMAISAFLPYLDATGIFSRVRENTLIQQEGWPLLLFALFALLTGYRGYSEGRRAWAPIVWGAFGLAVAIYVGSDKNARTLCAINPLNGEALSGEGCHVASVGIGVYLAGASGVITVIGGWIGRRTAVPADDEPDVATKVCPECAETVLAAANVCRFCGHRFADEQAATEASTN
jgi:hypothetical protein